MKKFIALTIATLIASPAFAAETIPAKDPYANRHKHGEFGMDLFKKLDSNGDGNVTKAELMAFHKAKFDSIDTNHDGKVTADEAKAAGRTKSFEKFTAKVKKPYLNVADTEYEEEENFNSADYNKDDKVSREEFKKHYLASFEAKEAKKNKK
jgi:hypothetical protein